MKKILKLMLTASVSTVVMLASCTEGDFPPPLHATCSGRLSSSGRVET